MDTTAKWVAAEIARVHYHSYEWSGDNGSAWDQLPWQVRERLACEADEWRASVEAAGFCLIERPPL